jgi:hypothetical protein
MKPHMSVYEIELLTYFLKHSNTYVEFGSGGSTVLASNYVKEKVISVESSLMWLEKVKKECEESRIMPKFYYPDIGDTREWGTPVDINKINLWSNYHEGVWGLDESWGADLYFIDGRFRVACFCQIYRRCDIQSLIAIHDFSSREKHYGIIRELGKEIASIENLSFFLPIPNRMKKSQEILDAYKYNHK